MNAVAQNLSAARELIADPLNYTTGTLARTETGLTADVQAPLAARFCALGAITKVTGAPNGHPMQFEDFPILGKAVRILATVIAPYWLTNGDYADPSEVVTEFGDTADHEDILAAYDNAIALATPACPED